MTHSCWWIKLLENRLAAPLGTHLEALRIKILLRNNRPLLQNGFKCGISLVACPNLFVLKNWEVKLSEIQCTVLVSINCVFFLWDSFQEAIRNAVKWDSHWIRRVLVQISKFTDFGYLPLLVFWRVLVMHRQGHAQHFGWVLWDYETWHSFDSITATYTSTEYRTELYRCISMLIYT